MAVKANVPGISMLIIVLLNFLETSAQVGRQSATSTHVPDRIPVLCYHQVRNWTSADSKNARTYIIPTSTFREHILTLHKLGFQTILPDQLVSFRRSGAPLPLKPILITFDDGTESQYTNALPALDQVGYKAVFFIMTVVLNKPRYMSHEMVRDISSRGHVIGGHTWDHQDVRRYSVGDWKKQLHQPTRQLEGITSKAVRYFAYPFGAWNDQAVLHLKEGGYAAAFQLWGDADKSAPNYTIRRILVDGRWSAERLITEIQHRYPKQAVDE